MLSLGEPRFSHAMICLAPDLIVHSDGEGVHIDTYSDLFQARYSENTLKVLRSRTLEQKLINDKNMSEMMRDQIQFYLGQAYNAALFFKRLKGKYDTTSFCSELIAKVYHDISVVLLPQRPRWVFPIHLQLLDSDSDWKDVTDVYTLNKRHEHSSANKMKAMLLQMREVTMKVDNIIAQAKGLEVVMDLLNQFTSGESPQRIAHEIERFITSGEYPKHIPADLKKQLRRLDAPAWYWDQLATSDWPPNRAMQRTCLADNFSDG